MFLKTLLTFEYFVCLKVVRATRCNCSSMADGREKSLRRAHRQVRLCARGRAGAGVQTRRCAYMRQVGARTFGGACAWYQRKPTDAPTLVCRFTMLYFWHF